MNKKYLYRVLVCLGFFWLNSANAKMVMNLVEGDAQAIYSTTEIASVFISDPTVADYQVIERNKVIVFGKSKGRAVLLGFDEQGKTLISRQLVVNTSMVDIQQQVKLQFPELTISITNVADKVVLSGVVSSEQEKDAIYAMVGKLLGKSENRQTLGWTEVENSELEAMTRLRYDGIVNHIEVATTKQVNVKLSIAEVSHSFLENFGIKMGSANAGMGTFVDQLVKFSAKDIVSVITAIGNDNVGQILAEPNLSVISGETASFLVGGELPVVTILDGGTNVAYKEFGIRLELAAKVLRDDKIVLSLMPEVSSLDSQYEDQAYNLPALKSRKARTTVELGDGQSFVLGGLLSTEDTESLQKIPFISEIPILGALFRHTESKRNKTELIIVATVNLVQPVETSLIQLPTMQKSTTLERFFAVESTYQTAADKWAKQILSTGGFQQ